MVTPWRLFVEQNNAGYHQGCNHFTIQIKHSCTSPDLWYLDVMDSLSYVRLCTYLLHSPPFLETSEPPLWPSASTRHHTGLEECHIPDVIGWSHFDHNLSTWPFPQPERYPVTTRYHMLSFSKNTDRRLELRKTCTVIPLIWGAPNPET